MQIHCRAGSLTFQFDLTACVLESQADKHTLVSTLAIPLRDLRLGESMVIIRAYASKLSIPFANQ